MIRRTVPQKTISKESYLEGVGLHTGKDVTLTFCPASENTGFAFKRIDLEDNLVLYFTGFSRSAGSILKDQKETNRKVSYEDISSALENRPDMVYYLEFEKIDAEKIIDKCIAVTLYTLAVSFVLLMTCELF